MSAAGHPFTLVLSGGNALGAYQAGVYAALHAADWLPDRVVGASIGAINGTLIAGNEPADRVARLDAFWQPGAGEGPFAMMEEWRRTLAASAALVTGRAGAFLPRLVSPFALTDEAQTASLFDQAPLDRTLTRLADLRRLDGGTPRLTVTAVDLESGEDVAFDSAHEPIRPAHVRASAALLPAFAPVEIGGRLLADGGLSANLPVDPVLAEGTAGVVVCVDLLPLAAPRPATLTDAASRLQDLTFAAQSRRAIDGWARLYAARGEAAPTITLIHLSYADQGREVAAKAFDFSPATIRDRWHRGARDARAMLAQVRSGAIPIADTPGLHVHRLALRPTG